MTSFFTWDFWCFRHFRRIPIEYLVPDKILQKRMLYSDLGATIREQNNRQRVNDAWAHARLRRPRFVKRGTIADGRVHILTPLHQFCQCECGWFSPPLARNEHVRNRYFDTLDVARYFDTVTEVQFLRVLRKRVEFDT